MPSDSPVQPSIAGRSDLPLSLISAGVFDKTHPTRPGWSAQVRVCGGEAVRAERHSMPLSSLLGCVHVSWIICARIAVSACSQGTPPTWCDSMCPPPRGGRGQGRGPARCSRLGPHSLDPRGGRCDGCSHRTAWTGSGHRHLLWGAGAILGSGT